jgi:hypothetical protein
LTSFKLVTTNAEIAIKIHILHDLKQTEFYTALVRNEEFKAKAGPQADFEARLIYKDIGPFFDMALEYARSDLTLPSIIYSEFLQSKRDALKHELEDLLQEKPYFKENLERTLVTIQPDRPYADIFSGTETARVLRERGLMVEYPNNSSRFKNSLAVSVVRSITEG